MVICTQSNCMQENKKNKIIVIQSTYLITTLQIYLKKKNERDLKIVFFAKYSDSIFTVK